MVSRTGSHWCKSGSENPFSSFPLSIWSYLQTLSAIPPGCWDQASWRWHLMLCATTCSPLAVTTDNWTRTENSPCWACVRWTCPLSYMQNWGKGEHLPEKGIGRHRKGEGWWEGYLDPRPSCSKRLHLRSTLCFQGGMESAVFLFAWCWKLCL